MRYFNPKYNKKSKTIIISLFIIATFISSLASINISYGQDNQNNTSTVNNDTQKIQNNSSKPNNLKTQEANNIQAEDQSNLFDSFLNLVVALGGWVGLIVTWILGQADLRYKTWDRLIESLHWFEGGTQKRSIGIALIECEWGKHKKFHRKWISILVNQAIYLLTKEKKTEQEPEAFHEEANLYRIMDLLTDKTKTNGNITETEEKLLGKALNNYEFSSKFKKIKVEKGKLETWKQFFPYKGDTEMGKALQHKYCIWIDVGSESKNQ